MSREVRRQRLLAIAACDRTFTRQQIQGRPAAVGKCIHCQRALTIPFASHMPTNATVEHIVPRHHGGTDELSNLALACARCNAQKGYRMDNRAVSDPRLRHLIELLQDRKRKRDRSPVNWATANTD